MAQQIGLEAVFDLGNFQKGMSQYASSLSKAVSDTDKASGSFTKSFNAMGSTVAKVTAIMGGALVAAGAAAGLALGKFAVDGIGQARDLEKQMSSIAAVLNMTAQEVAPLNDLILELGIDPNLSVSATQAADAIEMLARNGLSMGEIMDGAARSTVLLANATGADFATAADISTDAMSIFGIQAEDMGTAVNGITSVVSGSKFTIDDYALALSQGGAVANAAGVEFNDFNTSIAAISPLFASGSDAGTSFKTFVQNGLIPQTAEAKTAMQELGLMTAEGANQFYNANGSLKSMNEIAVLLNGALANLSEEQQNAALKTLFGADASRAAIGLMRSGEVVYTDLAQAVKETGLSQDLLNQYIEGGITQFELLEAQMSLIDANEQAKTRMDNFAGALEVLSGVIETIQIKIGQAFLPALTEMTRAFTAFVEEHSDSIVAFFESIATWLGTNIPAAINSLAAAWPTIQAGFAVLAEFIPPIVSGLTMIAGIVGTVLSAAFALVKDNMAAFQGALAGIALVMAGSVISAGLTAIAGALTVLLSPLALVVVGVAALGAAWNTNFLGMQDKTLAAIGVIQTAFAPLTSSIQQFGQGALTEIGLFATGNETEFTNAKAIWAGAQESFQNVFGGISTWLTTNLPIFVATLTQWGTAAAQWITDAIPIVTQTLTQWWTAISTYVNSQLPTWRAAFTEWTTVAWKWISDAAGLVASKFAEWWNQIKTYVDGQLPTWRTSLTEWTTVAWQWIVDAAGLVASKLGEWYAKLNTYVTGQLPAWQATFTEWATALWQWIVDATTEVATKMGEWYAALSDYLTENLPTWQTAFTEWGTAMVTWITEAGTKAQTELTTWATDLWNHATTDLLPKFKTKMLEWATGILEWISSADADPALKLAEWLGKILAWIPLGVAALVLEGAKLAGALIGWIAGSGNADSLVAQTDPEMEKFKTALTGALDNIKTIFIESVKTFVTSWKDTMNDHVDWNQLGKDILTAVRDGAVSMKASIETKIGEIADAIKKKFTDLADALIQVGKDIVQGLIDGIFSMKDTLIDKIKEFAQLLPDWMKYALGIESPSKVFAAIGVDVVLGLVQGIERQQKTAINAITSLTDGMLRAVRTGTDRIIDSFADSIGGLGSVGGSLASRIEDMLGDGAALPGSVKTFRQMEQGVELLQAQADLIDLIRQAGLNPATVLAGVTLGANANPQQLLGIINTTMANMANQLNNSILVASRGLEFEIERLRTARRSIEDVERNAMQAQLSQLERYRNQVTKLDEEIARTERNVLYSSGDVNQIKRLDEQREVILKDIETFLRQQAQLKQRMDNLPIANLTGRAATEAQAYIDKYITPLTNAFDKMTVVQRDATMKQIDELLTKLATFSYTAGHLGNVEKNVLTAVDGFGANVQNRVKAMLDTIYNPLTAVADRNQAISQLNTLANDLNRIQSRIDAQVGRHKSIDDFINELLPLDQIGYYKQRIGDVDKNLVRLNEQLLATGDVSLLERYTDLDMNRSEIEWELRKFLQQRQQFEALLTRVAEMPTIGAQAAQKFYDDQIQPLIDAFARPMTEAQRLANMALTQERITALNGYINAMERFEAMKVDLTSGMGGDPTMRNLTRIEQMLQNINTSEAERNRLMQEYRTEQEKLLAIQQKQQRLDFLNQQLNIVKQLETLNKDYDDIISVQNILSGITLGMNASVDDMITLTSRAIDAMIRAAQHQLGIASPSKVFEAMGQYVMQGLGKGITNAAMQPLNALRNVTSDMPYTLAQRNLTINMGGVAISNGMDEIMFEQKVRRIVNGMPV